ncbi:MAG: ATP-binding protein [Cyclobacteriaceae bacterium]
MGETEDITLLLVVVLGMLGMFLLTTAIVVFFIIYQKRLLNQQKKHQLVEEAYQRELLVSNIKNQEKERYRIATDLHDEIGALLTTTKLYTDQIDSTDTIDELTRIKNKANALLDETIDNVRRISLDLRPVILENFGISEAIENLKNQINHTGDIKIVTDLSEFGRFNYEQELALYRIIKELINNTMKHAEASLIEIQVAKTGRNICLTYQDNGKGFAPEQKSNGLGLKSIESRLNLLQSKLVYLEAEKGVKLQIEIATKNV